MGEVYKARDTRLERTVAVKILPAHLSRSEEVRQRFEREAKTISSLSHPHICALYDVGNQDGTEYLVMEFLEGETLTDRLSRGALPLDQVLRCGIEIAEALDKAHRQGIVHRDLKPGNIMLTKSGVKLVDFGLAKIAAVGPANSSVSILPTQAGMNLTQEGIDPRDVPIHGAGAAGGERGGRAQRHLRVRRRPLRDGDGTEGVRRQEPGVAHRVDPLRRATADLHRLADDAAGARPRRQDLPRQGARRPVADGARRDAAVEMDRRGGLAGRRAGPARRAAQEPGAPGLGHCRGPRSGDAGARRRVLRAAARGGEARAQLCSLRPRRPRTTSLETTRDRRRSPPTACRSPSRRGTPRARLSSGSARSTAPRRARWPEPRTRCTRSGPRTAGTSASSPEGS